MIRKNIYLGALGLLFSAAPLAAQFTVVATEADLYNNDQVTWNQLGPVGTYPGTAFSASSDRGVVASWTSLRDTQVKLGRESSTSSALLALFSAVIGEESIAITFDRPVQAFGVNLTVDSFSRTTINFRGAVRAYNGTSLVGQVPYSGSYPNLSFVGFRNPQGITKVTFETPSCQNPTSGEYDGVCSVGYLERLRLSSPVRVSVDVKPGADKDILVADSNAKPPLAILSAPGFNPVTQVNVSTLTFGRTGAESSIIGCTTSPDLNGDSVPELLCQFAVANTGLLPGDLTAKLKGTLSDYTPIYGSADVLVK